MTAIDPATSPARSATGDAGRRIVIWPHRSLSPRAMTLLLGSVGIIMALLAARAAAVGAWPAMIYPVLALAGFAFALRQNNRAGRFAQVIELHADSIEVREIGPASESTDVFAFNPIWVRVAEQAAGSPDTTRLVLSQSGRSLEIGRFLSQDERHRLACELKIDTRRMLSGAADRALNAPGALEQPLET